MNVTPLNPRPPLLDSGARVSFPTLLARLADRFVTGDWDANDIRLLPKQLAAASRITDPVARWQAWEELVHAAQRRHDLDQPQWDWNLLDPAERDYDLLAGLYDAEIAVMAERLAVGS